MTNSAKVNLYRKVEKDAEHGEFGLQKIEGETLFTKPTLLCCGGIMSNAHETGDNLENIAERLANGFAKTGHGLLGYKENFPSDAQARAKEPLDIVAVTYPVNRGQLAHDLHDYHGKATTGKKQSHTDFAKQFAEDHFFPLIQDKQKKPLALEQIKKNLRNVQVLAHSYGAAFIQQVGNALYERMEELHFTPPEIRDATQQVMVLAGGPTTMPAAGKASFTTVNIINKSDTEIDNLSPSPKEAIQKLLLEKKLLVNRNAKPVDPYTQMDIRGAIAAKPITIIPVKSNPMRAGQLSHDPDARECVAYVSQPLFTNSFGDIIKTDAITTKWTRSDSRGNFNGELDTRGDETGHQPATYYNYGIVNDLISGGPSSHSSHSFIVRTMAASALTNAMNNAIENTTAPEFKPLAAPMELLSYPETERYPLADDSKTRNVAAAIGYDERIKTAMDMKASRILGKEDKGDGIVFVTR